jgi:type II secretory pathway pseudopilin PulG
MVATLTIVATQIHVHVYVSSDPPWAILIAVVATLAAAFGGVLLTQRFENKRWQAQQRITANLAAANRLASTYSKLLIGAWAVESASKDLATAESDPGKLQAIRAILDTRKEMDGVLAALLIDPSASEVRAAYRESSRASAAFVIDPTDPDLLATVEDHQEPDARSRRSSSSLRHRGTIWPRSSRRWDGNSSS